MSNQDDVARRLTRISFNQMLASMAQYEGIAPPESWEKFIRNKLTEQRLLSNGWTLEEFAIACKESPTSTLKRMFGSLAPKSYV